MVWAGFLSAVELRSLQPALCVPAMSTLYTIAWVYMLAPHVHAPVETRSPSGSMHPASDGLKVLDSEL